MGDKDFFEQKIQAEIDAQRTRYKEHNWEFKERDASRHTIGDFISATMRLDKAEDAQRYYRGYIEWLDAREGKDDPKHTAKQVADANIGWCFGEGMSDERKAMWCSVSSASHPIFGRANVTAEEALSAGVHAADRGYGTTQ